MTLSTEFCPLNFISGVTNKLEKNINSLFDDYFYLLLIMSTCGEHEDMNTGVCKGWQIGWPHAMVVSDQHGYWEPN